MAWLVCERRPLRLAGYPPCLTDIVYTGQDSIPNELFIDMWYLSVGAWERELLISQYGIFIMFLVHKQNRSWLYE